MEQSPTDPDSRASRSAGQGRDPEHRPPPDLDVLDELARLARRYLEANRRDDVPVVQVTRADELAARLDLELGEEGVSERELLPLVEQYLRYAVRTGHPQFHNQLFSGFSLAGFLGEAVASLTNTTMSTFEAAPVATLMERRLLARLRALAGFEDGDGIFCTGGSNANLLGMLCARQRAFPEAAQTGLAAEVGPQVFVSDQAHYSLGKAARVLGIGSDNVVAVATDAGGRMDPAALERAVERSRAEGRTPFFIGATAGTTVLGGYDPLRAIAVVAARHGLWLHVDGSWGASALLSERHRGLLDGIELADSLAWDAHKMIGATLSCSAFLSSHPGVLRQASSADERDSAYLFHDGEDAELDAGRSSLQCGRRVDAFKLWLVWRRHGRRGLAARVEHLFALAELARARVAAHERLELLAPGQAPNVCFRWIPTEDRDSDAFNLAVRERLRSTGRALVNYASVRGRLGVRLALSNADLEPADVERFFQRFEEAALALERDDDAPRAAARARADTC